jgi:hypothetical protein
LRIGENTLLNNKLLGRPKSVVILESKALAFGYLYQAFKVLALDSGTKFIARQANSHIHDYSPLVR